MTTATRGKQNKRLSDAPSGEQCLAMLRQMLLIRRFEQRCAQSYQQARIGGFCHLYIGQEAVAVGSIAALRPDDPIITAYRDHGHALARGMDPRYAMAEMFGKLAGCCKGKGGSMHLFDRPHHMFGGHAIVGGQLPLGAGIAFGIKYLAKDNVCACYLGDGALNQGAFHESMNLAAIWQLPILFVVEDNRYSMGTSIDRGTSKADDLSVKAAAYGMRFAQCDGMDALAVYDCFKTQAEPTRRGDGPVFIHVKTYRYKGHSMSDPQKYRTRQEVADFEDQDCINRMVNHMIEAGQIDQDQVNQLDKEAKRMAIEAVKFADEAQDTPADEMFTDIYSQPFGPFQKGELPQLLKDDDRESPAPD